MVQELDMFTHMPATRLKFPCVCLLPLGVLHGMSACNGWAAKPLTVLTSLFAMAAVMSPEDKKGLMKYRSCEALSGALPGCAQEMPEMNTSTFTPYSTIFLKLAYV